MVSDMSTNRVMVSLVGLIAISSIMLGNGTDAVPQQDPLPVQNAAKPPRPWLNIQATTYQFPDEVHRLTLSEKELSEARELSYVTIDRYAQLHPGHTTLPNAMFVLTDNIVGSSNEKTLWVQYVFHNKAILPHQHWFANLVWPEGEPQPYVVLTMSTGTTVEASVYKVPLTANLGPLVQEPDLNQFEKLPRDSPALSRVYIADVVPRFSDGVTGAVKLDAVADQDGILLRSREREIATEPPFYIRFNPRSGQWQKGTNPDALQGLDPDDILK